MVNMLDGFCLTQMVKMFRANGQVTDIFLGDGRMASGPVTVGDYKYFFERSSSTQCRGKKYKSQWITYNNKFYYATKRADYMEPDGKQSMVIDTILKTGQQLPML